MAFHVVEPRTVTFGHFDDLFHFANDEVKRTIRLPLMGLLRQGAYVVDDMGIGVGNRLYRLNDDSFQALCGLAGVSPSFLQGIESPGLASHVLNDVLRGGRLQRAIEALQIICDTDNDQILGFVSDRYHAYSNQRFLADVLRCIDPVANEAALLPSLGSFEFREAYSINTRMYLRLYSKHAGGTVHGRGGSGEDVTEIGFQAFNTMAGGQAVRFSYFIHRLVCANGLVAPVAGAAGRIIHTGSEESFNRRMRDSSRQVMGGLGKAAQMIESLGRISFDSDKLIRHMDAKQLFSITGQAGLRDTCEHRVSPGDYNEIPDPAQRKHRKAALALEAIPDVIGNKEAREVFDSRWRDNASMWDFINIFTAHAQTQPLRQRLKTEERAGEVAHWIAKNARKFA